MVDKRSSFFDCGISHITLNGRLYQLDSSKPVGRGGTCLVYHALRHEAGNPRRVIIKEFYPISVQSNSLRKPNGNLELPDIPSIPKYQNRFTHSYEMFKYFFNMEELNSYTVQAQEKIHEYGTTYMIVDYSNGIILEDYISKIPSLFDFFTHMKILSVVLDRMHSQGIVHMDLKPSNILCFDDGPVKYCKLMDTDSFLKKNISADELSVSISEGYVAPEIYRIAYLMQDPFGNRPQIEWEIACFARTGEKADIFSFGVILFHYLFGYLPNFHLNGRRIQEQIWQEQLNDFLKELPKYLKMKNFTIAPKAIFLIKKLLHGTLAGVPDNRYSAKQIENLISKILPLLDLKETKIVENFSPNPHPVVGREEQLDTIKGALNHQETKSRIVVITGLGGIGKSTLARHYAEIHREEYDIITEISASSAEQAVMFIPIQAWDTEKMEQIYLEPDANDSLSLQRRIELLATLNNKFKTLLIVNNYDITSNTNDSIWNNLNCDIILTSRKDWSKSGKKCVMLTCNDFAPRENFNPAKEIFRFFFLEQSDSEVRRKQLNTYLERESYELDQLLLRMNYHPLGLKLLARYMTVVPGEEMLPSQALLEFNHEIFDQSAPEEFINDRDSIVFEENLHGHLARIFHTALEKSHLTDSDIDALRYMTLVSSFYGISIKRFQEWTGMKSVYLSRLKNQSWLEYLPQQQDYLTETNQGVYIMPTVIQEVLLKEPILKSTSQNCGQFLKQCALHYNDFLYFSKIRSRFALYAQQDILVRALSDEKTEDYIRLLHNVVSFTRRSDLQEYDPDELIRLCKLSIKLAFKYPDKPALLGRCYNEISKLYINLNQIDKAYSYCMKNWQILRNQKIHDDDTSEWLAEWLESIVPIYLPEKRAADMIGLLIQCKSKLPKNRSKFLLLYGMFESLVGDYFMSIGQLDFARSYIETALSSFQQETDDIENANRGKMRTYHSLGDLCLQQRDLFAAEIYLIRSMELHLRIVGEDHFQLCQVLYSLASTYVLKHQISDAFDYHIRIKNILDRINPNHSINILQIVNLLEIYLDVQADSTLKNAECLARTSIKEAIYLLNQETMDINVTDIYSAIIAIEQQIKKEIDEALTFPNVGLLNVYALLCIRTFKSMSNVSYAYQRIARIYKDYGFFTIAKRYLSYAKNEE